MWLWVHHTMHVNFIDLQVSLIISKIHKSSTKQYQAPVFEHRKSRAIERPATAFLLWCYLGIFTPKKSFAKNNTNSDLFSGFVLFAYGGGNRARSTAIAIEGQSRAVWPKSQGARECAVRNAPSSSDNYTNERKTLLFSRVSGCWWR